MFKRKTFLLAMSLMLLIPLMVGGIVHAQGTNEEEIAGTPPEEITTPQQSDEPVYPYDPAVVDGVISLPEVIYLPYELVYLRTFASPCPYLLRTMWRNLEAPLLRSEAMIAAVRVLAKADPRVQELLEHDGVSLGEVWMGGILSKGEVLEDGMVPLTLVGLWATVRVHNLPWRWRGWSPGFIELDLKQWEVVNLRVSPPCPDHVRLIEDARRRGTSTTVASFLVTEEWRVYQPIDLQGIELHSGWFATLGGDRVGVVLMAQTRLCDEGWRRIGF